MANPNLPPHGWTDPNQRPHGHWSSDGRWIPYPQQPVKTGCGLTCGVLIVSLVATVLILWLGGR